MAFRTVVQVPLVGVLLCTPSAVLLLGAPAMVLTVARRRPEAVA